MLKLTGTPIFDKGREKEGMKREEVEKKQPGQVKNQAAFEGRSAWDSRAIISTTAMANNYFEGLLNAKHVLSPI